MAQPGFPPRAGSRRSKPTAADTIRRIEPDPPDTLTGTALDEWHRVMPWAYEEGLVTAADLPLLESWCSAVARWRELDAKLDDVDDLVAAGSNGNQVQSPIYKTHRELSQLLISLAQQLGFSPAARLRMPALKRPEDERPVRPVYEMKPGPDPRHLLGAS
ncbi:MAG: phage terminase small subunit P27 family [Chloroflexi bacterium]|nr:phage terminase small subunit P27 family [Chloroflexota bacterium]